jgi:hypothetical protein
VSAEALGDPGRERLPPVTELGVVSMALIVAGGISIAARLPGNVPLGLPVVLLAASALVLGFNVLSLVRTPGFNWDLFFEVARWALLAYCVIAAMLEYVFVKDGTRGGILVVLTLSLVVFAVHVPLLIGFTVARYQPKPVGSPSRIGASPEGAG